MVIGFLLALVLTQDVDALIARLGDSDLAARGEAEAAILKIGKRALDPLKRATKAADREIAGRAAALLDEIDWPDPGPASNGLTLEIKPKPGYSANEPLMVRARLTNVGDRDVVLDKLSFENESDTMLLDFGGQKDLHLCHFRREPGPDLPATVRISKGQRVAFTFSARSWCSMLAHSKCGPVSIGAGEHAVTVAFSHFDGSEGTWKGRVSSSEVKLVVRP